MEFVLGNDAAVGGARHGGEHGGEAGVAAENLEDHESFVGTRGSAQTVGELNGAGDAGAESDAVVRSRHVIVHGLRDADDLEAFLIEPHGVAQRVVPADGNQVFDAEPSEILEHFGSEIVLVGAEAVFELRWDAGLADAGGIGAGGMEKSAAGAAGAIHDIFGEKLEVIRVVVVFVANHVHKSAPAAADADHLIAFAKRAEGHGADGGVEAGNIAASCEDANDAFSGADVCHDRRIIPSWEIQQQIIAPGAAFRKREAGLNFQDERMEKLLRCKRTRVRSSCRGRQEIWRARRDERDKPRPYTEKHKVGRLLGVKLLRGCRQGRSRGVLDSKHVGAGLVPLSEHEPVGGKEAADFGGIPTQDFLQHRNEDAHGAIAEHRSARRASDELGLGDGDGQAVVLIDVHHDGKIGAAVAHVNDVVMADGQIRADFFQHGDFAPACGSANDGIHFARGVIVTEARAMDALRRNDAFERGLDDLLGRGGDHVEMKLVAVGEIVKQTREECDVVLQPDALAGFDQVLAADAPDIRVVENQIAQLGALLDKVHRRKSLNLVRETMETDQLAKDNSRVIETERLVKIAGQ